MTEQIHETVRDHYARAATTASAGESCCTDSAGIGPELYSALERQELPDSAVLASLGCGNPTAVADLRPGEVVLDLGSGGGIDVLLSARRVGPTGKAYGLDMTEEMLALARRNAAEAGASNVEFLKGYIEQIPLPAETVDVVISNCVVNLAADKRAVFQEVARVLRPGGRIGITDIVAEDHLTSAQRAERGSYEGCIAGALSMSEFEAGLREVGLSDVTIRPTHSVAEGMVSAIVQATKPADSPALADSPAVAREPAREPALAASELPLASNGCCGGVCCS